ncbi:PPC domain-containing protein, partial [Akkermansiaceae bacterium]|nr:PPC domain-containing protein [Akkermansiaceae bacterium]
MKNTGYVAIGTFKLSREDIASLSSASALDAAFYQFGAATNFNSLENGAFQGSASGDPAELYDGLSPFAGAKVYIVIGNGSDLITSSEFLVWDSELIFDGTGPTGGPWEVVLSVDSGDLIIGLSDKNTSDFSLIGGGAGRGAFTTVMIDEALDDHGNAQESATFITENSTTSGKIDDGADVDYFRVDLSEDGNLFVKINQNLELNLYDGEGVLIEAVQDAGDGLGGGVAADFTISKDLAAGTYYVSIGGDENT